MRLLATPADMFRLCCRPPSHIFHIISPWRTCCIVYFSFSPLQPSPSENSHLRHSLAIISFLHILLLLMFFCSHMLLLILFVIFLLYIVLFAYHIFTIRHFFFFHYYIFMLITRVSMFIILHVDERHYWYVIFRDILRFSWVHICLIYATLAILIFYRHSIMLDVSCRRDADIA